MDSEQFDGLVRRFGQTWSRRQTVRGLAGAGALLALRAAKPVAAEKAAKPNAPHKAPKNPGTGQPGNSQPGNGQPGGGQLGSTDSLLCGYQCNDALTDCEYACFNASSGSADPDPACYDVCNSQNDACVAACPPE